MPQHLFLYGTLMPDRQSDAVRRMQVPMTLIGTASVQGALYDCGDYPGCVMVGERGIVWGVIVDLPDDPAVWARLDRYEDARPEDPVGSLFRRERCEATLARTGQTLRCWIYVYNRETTHQPRLAEGRWHKRTSQWTGP